jgi:hypothetical protein
MKFKLTPDEHKALDESIQGEYTEKDGDFILNLEGHEDHFAPKAKLHIAESHRREAEKKVAEGEAREADLLSKLENADGKKAIEEIRANAQAQIDKVKAEYAEKEEAAKLESNKNLVAAEAGKFAGENFTIPSLIQDAYAKRLSVEEVDGKQVIRVLESDGTASAKSIVDLQKEFLDNAEYAPIIKAAQSSGSGATKDEHSGGSSAPKSVEFSLGNKKAATEAVIQKLAAAGHDVSIS